jgi:hypothetical protein
LGFHNLVKSAMLTAASMMIRHNLATRRLSLNQRPRASIQTLRQKHERARLAHRL